MAIARDLALAEETGAPVHFRQVTTARGLSLVREAKAKGLPVLCGITPAHLLLSDTAIGDFRTFARLSPPLRSEDDRHACLAAIEDGTIDILSSGHDPRGPERSEEHTSELQSPMRISSAVSCLKQKKHTNTKNYAHQLTTLSRPLN